VSFRFFDNARSEGVMHLDTLHAKIAGAQQVKFKKPRLPAGFFTLDSSILGEHERLTFTTSVSIALRSSDADASALR
jgi:hypothetical protein